MAQGTLNHSFEEVTVLLGLSNTFPSLDRSNSSVRAKVTGFFASMSAVEATNITQNSKKTLGPYGTSERPSSASAQALPSSAAHRFGIRT
jgi:hypothetical protein